MPRSRWRSFLFAWCDLSYGRGRDDKVVAAHLAGVVGWQKVAGGCGDKQPQTAALSRFTDAGRDGTVRPQGD
jgi:hypothetical protein